VLQAKRTPDWHQNDLKLTAKHLSDLSEYQAQGFNAYYIQCVSPSAVPSPLSAVIPAKAGMTNRVALRHFSTVSNLLLLVLDHGLRRDNKKSEWLSKNTPPRINRVWDKAERMSNLIAVIKEIS